MGRHQVPAAGAGEMIGRREGELLWIDGAGVDGFERDDDEGRVALEAETREASGGIGCADAAHQLVEEIALELPLGIGDRARLRELDREQAERVPGDDPVELRRLLGLADREERLDPAGRTHRLQPHVVPTIDERDREVGAVRT
jgi:hypothetical protein